ncbi:hypothetical protein B0H12DRAFT_184729 [Mycena haematopus]|nr:hypothetical protein B0H12DRAFT_184729 [Mycena haematopus]
MATRLVYFNSTTSVSAPSLPWTPSPSSTEACVCSCDADSEFSCPSIAQSPPLFPALSCPTLNLDQLILTPTESERFSDIKTNLATMTLLKIGTLCLNEGSIRDVATKCRRGQPLPEVGLLRRASLFRNCNKANSTGVETICYIEVLRWLEGIRDTLRVVILPLHRELQFRNC